MIDKLYQSCLIACSIRTYFFIYCVNTILLYTYRTTYSACSTVLDHAFRLIHLHLWWWSWPTLWIHWLPLHWWLPTSSYTPDLAPSSRWTDRGLHQGHSWYGSEKMLCSDHLLETPVPLDSLPPRMPKEMEATWEVLQCLFLCTEVIVVWVGL